MMDGAFWVLLVALLLFATTILMHRLVDIDSAPTRLPVTWFYSTWLVGLFLLALPLFKYSESFSGLTGAYFLGILFAYSCGSLVAAFWSKRKPSLSLSEIESKTVTQPLDISARWIFWLLILGLIGSILMLTNTLLSGGLSLVDRLDAENLAAIRTSHLARAESRIGLLYGPAALMSSIGGLGVAYAFFLRGSRAMATTSLAKNKWLSNLATLVLILNIVIGFIAFGSRIVAVFAILIAFFAFVEGRWSIGEKLIVRRLTLRRFSVIFVSAVLTATVLWAAATIFLEKRVQGQDPQSLLFRTHRAAFSPFLFGLIGKEMTLQYFMLSVSYFSTPIPTLAFYLDLPDSRQPGPFYGEYNFPAVARWGRRLTFSGDPYAWERARYDIFKPLSDINFGMNVWSTLVRDLIADFTKGGAVVFVAVLGFFVQRTYDLNRKSPSARRAGLLVHLRLLLVFSGLISILFLPQFHWALYLSFIFVMTGRRRRRRPILVVPAKFHPSAPHL